MRAFIALDLTADVQDRLQELIRRLSFHTVKVKWVDSRQIHLTLKFFPALTQAQIEPLSRVLGETARRFHLVRFDVRGVGFFASGARLRVLWCGVGDASGKLATLQKTIEDRLLPVGFPREDRPFKPHLTLGRLREPSREPQLVQALKAENAFHGGSVQADRLVLYSSTLTPSGPIYRTLAQWRFEGGP